MAKKKFKNTKFGMFLNRAGDAIKKNGGDIASIALKAATGNISGAISDVSEIIKGDATPETTFLHDELINDRKDWEMEMLKTVLEDVGDARNMQEVALGQDDKFSKRFIYYLASGVFLFAVLFVIMLFFVEIPESNKRLVDVITGVIVGTGLTQVIQFFFGSSKGSKEKTSLMSKN
jgi:hypothetical protein